MKTLLTLATLTIMGGTGCNQNQDAYRVDSESSEAPAPDPRAAKMWGHNLTKAQTQAKGAGKLVLLDFTGSDWCPPCMALHDFVLTQTEFLDFAEKHLELVELEVRELLSSYEFPGDDIPIVKGSALAALEDGDENIGKNSVIELMAAVDDYIPTPDRPKDQAFLMPIEDVFSISGRGTVCTGRIERGIVKVGDEVEIVGIRPTTKTTVTGVEMFRKLLDEGRAGENVGVLLRGTKRDDVERGQVLCVPGSIKPHTKFECEVYVLSKEEGGRHTPFFANYRPQFYFRTTDVTGIVTLPEGTEMVMPGDNVTVDVALIVPIAMEEKLRFAIREGGRTVGAGIVASIIE